MKKTLALTLLALVIASPALHACTCEWAGAFMKVAERSELVLRARVVEYQWSPRDSGHQAPPVSMMIEILEVYKGAPASHTIIVQGDRGVQCRPYVSRFPIGTEWVFALWTNPTGSGETEIEIPICGEHWLEVIGTRARGLVTEGTRDDPPREMSLRKLGELLKGIR